MHAPVTNDNGFEYEALPDAKTHIRLIRFLRAENDKSIECELTTWPLDRAPEYKAISYAWGDSTQQAVMRVNGSTISVASNTEYAARQGSWSGPAYFWIDAICIDQQNKDEKSQQVQMMGKIFGSAVCVLACIGPHVLRSEFADLFPFAVVTDTCKLMRHVNRHEKLLIQIGKCLKANHRKDANLPDARYAHTRYGMLRRSRMLTYVFCRTPVSLLGLRIALTDLMDRRYFSRLWVAQELFAGKDVLLCCGDSRASCVAVEGLRALLLLEFWMLGDMGQKHLMPVPRRLLLLPYRILFAMRRYLGHRSRAYAVATFELELHFTCSNLLARGGSLNMVRQSLGALIEATTRLKCGSPIDAIYGILAIMPNEAAAQIRVDYTMPRYELAVEVCRILTSSSRRDNEYFGTIVYLATSLALRVEGDVAAAAVNARRGNLLPPTSENSELGTAGSMSQSGWCIKQSGKDLVLEAMSPFAERGGPDGELLLPKGLLADYQGTTYRPLSVDGHLVAIAHGDTQAGDILVCIEPPIGDYSCRVGLIIRPTAEDHHTTIVGKVIFNSWTSDIFANTQYFGCRFDIEDLLVLYAHANFVLPDADMLLELSNVQLADYFAVRVCRSKDSSYIARRSR